MNNELIEIPEENIYLEFILNNKNYAVISNSKELEENDEIYLAKIDEVDGIRIMRNIESEEEYNQIQKKLTKVAYEERRKLKKIKEVDNFIRNDLSNVMWELKRAHLDKNSSSSALAIFFNNCNELSFLNDEKIIKKLK